MKSGGGSLEEFGRFALDLGERVSEKVLTRNVEGLGLLGWEIEKCAGMVNIFTSILFSIVNGVTFLNHRF